MSEYFACVFRLGGVANYVIWYSDERNGLLRENGQVLIVTPAGAECYPTWTNADVAALARVLRLGIAEIRQQLVGGRVV